MGGITISTVIIQLLIIKSVSSVGMVTATPVQVRTDPEDSRSSKLPEF